MHYASHAITYVLSSSDEDGKRIRVAKTLLATLTDPTFESAVTKLVEHYEQHAVILPHDYLVQSYNLTVPLQPQIPIESVAYDSLNREVERRRKQKVLTSIVDLVKDSPNLTEDQLHSKLSGLVASRTTSKQIRDKKSGREIYDDRRNVPTGPLLHVKPLDEKTRGHEMGTLTVIAGFVGSFKTTTLMNVVYNNAVNLGYNSLYMTLEVPRDILHFQLLSRHSYNDKFQHLMDPIQSIDIIKGTLTPDQEIHLFDVVEDDLLNDPNYGRIEFIEESDLDSFTAPDIEAYVRTMAFQPHILVLDYIQLCRYLRHPSTKGMSVNDVGDYYVRQFSELAKNCNGQKVAFFVGAQTNRSGWEEASKNEGRYELNALSELRELERSAKYVIFSFADEQMKEAGELKIALAKSTLGQTLLDPVITFVDPRFSYMGDQSGGFATSTADTNFANLFGDF